MEIGETVRCLLCGQNARFSGMQHGYAEGTEFHIYQCLRCRVVFPHPCQVSAEIYDNIYRQARKLPGYASYVECAEAAVKRKDPLAFLAGREDSYWVVQNELGENPGKTLEVGCGLGYLTFALRRKGIDAFGSDIAESAIKQAGLRFGDYFIVASLKDLVAGGQKYDTIIMTEVIEHVPEPLDFLKDAVRLLRQGGKIIMTTPNRSAFAPDTVWCSDCPPVHLWWFAEESMVWLAEQCGCTGSFTDFSPLNRSRYLERETGGNYFRRFESRSRLDRCGRALPDRLQESRSSWRASVFATVGVESICRSLRAKCKGTYGVGSRRPTLGVVLRTLGG